MTAAIPHIAANSAASTAENSAQLAASTSSMPVSPGAVEDATTFEAHGSQNASATDAAAENQATTDAHDMQQLAQGDSDATAESQAFYRRRLVDSMLQEMDRLGLRLQDLGALIDRDETYVRQVFDGLVRPTLHDLHGFHDALETPLEILAYVFLGEVWDDEGRRVP